MNAESKTCQNCKSSFIIEPEDLGYYERLGLPPPEFCPKCRWKYMLAFWLNGRFRVTTSAFSGKRIITVIPESAPFPIYDRQEFVSDTWDPLSYGQSYDPSRAFIDQLVELQAKVPHPHQTGTQNVNCDWSDDVWESRETYLTRSAWLDEFISYSYRVFRSKNSIDLTYCIDVENSYDCLYCFKSYELRHSFNCRDCIASAFLYDCRNCQSCFLSWNLRNKQYCILNQQYSKEDYLKKLKEFNFNSYSGIEDLKKTFWNHIREDAVHRANYNVQTANSSGNFLTQDKNCYQCYFLEKSENCRYCFRGTDSKDSIDIVGSVSEKCGRGTFDQWGYGNICSLYTSHCRYTAYLDNCEECENCFGCVGLRKKSYCILNKQYSKVEYERLKADILKDMTERGEWGKFFPLGAAYGGYNYSLAQWMFPMTSEEAIRFGAKWDEPIEIHYDAISGNSLPESIKEVGDEIVKQRIICSETGLSYNITPSELEFYRKYNLPLPRRHFDRRNFKRFEPMTKMVEPRRDKCFYCKKEVEHYYAPELGFKKITCVECYQKEIV